VIASKGLRLAGCAGGAGSAGSERIAGSERVAGPVPPPESLE